MPKATIGLLCVLADKKKNKILWKVIIFVQIHCDSFEIAQLTTDY